MIALLLMVMTGQDSLVRDASAKLSVRCQTERCGEPEKRSPYRLGADDAGGDAKGRAIEDGTKCNVVGSRVCTRKPRTVFSTAIDQ